MNAALRGMHHKNPIFENRDPAILQVTSTRRRRWPQRQRRQRQPSAACMCVYTPSIWQFKLVQE
jgi:hypothetical protein